MKLTNIQISNFLGARAVDVRLAKPVCLFAGKNGAGKSSIQEAVRMALTGETVRVGLKKDYAALISEGQESGFAAVECSNAGYEAVLPSGNGNHSDNAMLPYVLDAQRFSRMTENDRRSFLFGLMGVKLDGPAIKQRLVATETPDGATWKARGCNAAKVEQILPILRAGFDAASKEAANKARDAKANWKTATGGDTWGKDKAAKWQPAPLPDGAESAGKKHDNAVENRKMVDAELATANQELGAAKAEQKRHQEAEAKRLELHTKAGHIKVLQDKVAMHTAELAEWERKVSDTRALAGGKPNPKAPGEFLLRGLAVVVHDMLGLDFDYPEEICNRAAIHLGEFRKLHGEPVEAESKPNPQAVSDLPKYEQALSLTESTIANAKRDLAVAEQAAATLKELDGLKATADVDVIAAKVAELTETRNNWQTDADKYRDIADKYARRQTLIEQVAKLHADVMAWTAIADALAPDGIPAELLSEALGPMNHRLAVTAGDAQWDRIEIMPDMQIMAALHGRPYALLSESEKWRADAMIAEAVSHISGVKLLVLDRYDVLDGQGREDALYWLDGLAENGEIDTALIFGTLKGLPAQLLPNIESVWIENGTAGQMKGAA